MTVVLITLEIRQTSTSETAPRLVQNLYIPVKITSSNIYIKYARKIAKILSIMKVYFQLSFTFTSLEITICRQSGYILSGHIFTYRCLCASFSPRHPRRWPSSSYPSYRPRPAWRPPQARPPSSPSCRAWSSRPTWAAKILCPRPC